MISKKVVKIDIERKAGDLKKGDKGPIFVP
jgi:hypothetical protein